VTVYVDAIRTDPGGRKWCRLMGTELVELEDFAVVMGIPSGRLVLPNDGPRFYPLTEQQREKAIRKGAKCWDRVLPARWVSGVKAEGEKT
jgi:hypothetical protein